MGDLLRMATADTSETFNRRAITKSYSLVGTIDKFLTEGGSEKGSIQARSWTAHVQTC